MGRISVNGEISPRITFEKEVVFVVSKVITDLEVGDPEKATTEEVDHVHCRTLIFTKN